MGQFVLISLFIITLMVGAFNYIFPPEKNIDLLKLFLEGTRYNVEEANNAKKIQQLETGNSKGLTKTREQIDDLASKNNDFNQHIKDLVDDNRQKAKEQQDLNQQRLEDQKQRMQDLKDLQNRQ